MRGCLSHYPILYGLLGGIGIVLFWRGVWYLADDLHVGSLESFIISVIILLLTGLFVSVFIGDQVIISGLHHEKKLVEKTEEELKKESDSLASIRKDLKNISNKLEKIEQKILQK